MSLLGCYVGVDSLQTHVSARKCEKVHAINKHERRRRRRGERGEEGALSLTLLPLSMEGNHSTPRESNSASTHHSNRHKTHIPYPGTPVVGD